MKKLYILTLLIITFGFQFAFSQTVTLGTVPTTLCANEKLYIPVTLSGTFNSNNVVQIEISNAAGVFVGTYIGALLTNSTGEQFIPITVDPSSTYSPSYLLRARTNSPILVSLNALVNINCTTRDYFWVGGTGNWSDFSTHWATSSGGSVFHTEPPTNNDDVYFDSNSFPSGGSIDIDQVAYCNDMTWTDGSTNPSIIGGSQLNVRGKYVLAPGVGRNHYETAFNSMKQNLFIDLAGASYEDSYFNFQGGGAWSIQNDISLSNLYILGGQVNTNGFSVKVRGLLYGNGNPANVLNTGSGDVRVGRLSSNGMLITGNSQWYFTPEYNGTFELGRDVNLTSVIIEGGTYNIYGDNSIDNLTLESGTTINIQDGYSLTVSNTLVAVGTRDKMISINSQSGGLQGTIIATSASLTLEYVQIQDNIIDNGLPQLVLPNNAIDNGNNTGWDFSNAIVPLDFYWVGGSGNWSENSSHWAKLSGGGGFHDSAPGPLDDVIFDQNSFPSGGTLIVDSEIEITDMIWTTGSGANNPILQAWNGNMTIHGDFILDVGVQRRIDNIYFESSSGEVQNLHFGDNSGDEYSQMYFQGGGTWNLSSELITYYMYLYDGTFNSNDNNVEVQYLYLYDDLSISNWGNSTVTIRSQVYKSAAGATFNANNSTFKFESDYQSNLTGPLTFNNAIFSSDAYINSDNIFNNLTFEPGIKVSLQNGSTQSFVNNFAATGLRDQPITIESNSSGSAATITSLTTGTFNTEYLILQDNTVSGATFNTDNSLNNGNVTGWTFGTPLTSLNFYWVGNEGSWSDYANHWALQADGGTGFHTFSPGPVDDVYFTTNSFSSTGQTVLLDNPTSVRNMTWEANSGNNNPSISGDNDNPLTITGSFYLDNGVNRNLRRIYFDSPVLNNAIDFADNTGDVTNTYIYFRGTGSWDMASRIEASGISLEDATLNTNGMELDVYDININNSNAVLNAGSSDVYFNYLYDGGGTINPGSSNFIVSDYGYIQIYGSSTFNDLTITIGANLSVYTDITVANFTIEPGAILQNSQGITINTASFSAVGLGSNPITIKSNSPGFLSYISQPAGVVNADFLIISDNEALGGATFNASNSLDGGNVFGWNIFPPVAKDYYWVGGDGLWSEAGSHWVNTDGGNTFYTGPPGLADNVFFTDNSFTAPGQAVTLDAGKRYINNVTWSTSSSLAPYFYGEWLNVYGSFTLSDGVFRGINQITFEALGTSNTVHFADNIIGTNDSYIEFIGTGDWNLTSDLEVSQFSLRGGTFNAGNNYINIDYLQMYGSGLIAFNADAATVDISELYFDSYNNNITFNGGTSTINLVTNDGDDTYFQIYGSLSPAFNIVNFNSNTWVYGNSSFNEFNVAPGVTMRLGNGNIQTIQSLNLVGTSTDIISIESNSKGNESTFSVPASGSVSADYVILEDNYAVGGASFAATNSSQLSNVQGWTGLLDGQTINFPPLDDLITETSRTMEATATSGLSVSYELIPITGTGTINGSTFDAGTNGLVSIRATQGGDGTFGPAKPVTDFLYVGVGDEVNELGQMKQPSYVVGAPNRVTEGDPNPTQTSVTSPYKAIVSPDGHLIVAGYARIMIWNQLPDDYNIPADVVVGEADFTDENTTPSQSTLTRARGVAIGPSGELIVADGPRGVMIWNSIPTSSGAPADVVIGQTSFTSETPGLSADKFQYVRDVAVSPDGKLIVCDGSNHRVLVFNEIPTTNGASADVVIGQQDFNSNVIGTSENELQGPYGITVSQDGALFIADLFNNRVLMFNTVPTSNYAAADRVFGQPDFSSNSNGTSATQFYYPWGVAVSSSGKLAISDYFNNRVLVYNQIPADGSVSPDLVLGQPTFTEGSYYDIVDSRHIGNAGGLFWDASENFFITDPRGRRIMVYGAKDLEPPVIQSINHLSPYYTIGGTNQTSSAIVTDRSGIQSATAYWQEVGSFNPASPAYEQEPLIDLGSDQFQFDVSILETKGPNPIGIEYYVEFIDKAGNSINNINSKQVLPVHYSNGTSLNTYGVGSTTEDYRLMAVPLELDNAAVENVFSSIYGGTFDKSEMRVFSYAGGTATTYNEAAASTNLSVGKGYFALAKTGSPGSVTLPAGTTSFISTSTAGQNIHEFTINLVNGWNLIGNPFSHPVKWVDIETLSGITTGEVDNLQNYSGGGYDATITSIPVGGGAFVLNNTGSSFSLRIPALVTAGGRVASTQENKNPLSESSWEVLFKALSNDNQEILLGGVGMEEEAEYSKDKYDRVNPPAFGSMKLIEFAHPEYIASSFKKDIRETADEEKWSFEYKNLDAENNKHKIHWDNSYFGENAPDIYLVDKSHFTVVNMKEENSYTFSHAGITKFEVYYGNNSINELSPDKLVVQTPYPNPFNKEVTFNIGLPSADNEYKVIVGIYDTMGKQVTTLLIGNMNAGYYSFNWQGESNLGNQVPKGIYAYRVVITGATNKVVSGKVIKN